MIHRFRIQCFEFQTKKRRFSGHLNPENSFTEYEIDKFLVELTEISAEKEALVAFYIGL